MTGEENEVKNGKSDSKKRKRSNSNSEDEDQGEEEEENDEEIYSDTDEEMKANEAKKAKKDKKDLLKYSPSDFNFSEQLPRCLRNEGEFLTAQKFD